MRILAILARTSPLLLLVVCFPISLEAQVRYKDADGVTHWVDSIDKVPEQYRKDAVSAPARSGSPMMKGAPTTDWEQKSREIDAREARKAFLSRCKFYMVANIGGGSRIPEECQGVKPSEVRDLPIINPYTGKEVR